MTSMDGTDDDEPFTLENETRQAKEQVAELGRTATEYSSMIQKKEEQISELNDQLEAPAL